MPVCLSTIYHIVQLGVGETFKVLFQSSILVGENFGKLLYSYNRNASDGEYNIGEFMAIDLPDLPTFSPATVLCGIIIMGMSYCYNYWWYTFV